MTVQELAEFGKLKAAIEALKKRKIRIMSSAVSATQELSGMPGGKGTTGDIVGNGASKLADIEHMIAKRLWEMETRRDSIAEYISTVSDPIIFTAMTYHYLDGLTWNATAHAIGGNTSDSLRMEVKRYVKANP